MMKVIRMVAHALTVCELEDLSVCGCLIRGEHIHIESQAAADALAALVGIPGLTPEQLAVAQAEAVLEEAQVDDACGFVQPWLSGHEWQYLILRHDGQARYWTERFPTRLAAAQAAVARLRELPAEAEKKKLPEPEAMDYS